MMMPKIDAKERIVWAVSSGKDHDLIIKPNTDLMHLEAAWKKQWNARGKNFDRLILMDQIHAAKVVRVTGGSPSTIAETDGVVTDIPGLLLAVRVADCLPVLIWDTTRGVIAAVHAGWRGMVAGVIEEALKKMLTEFSIDPQHLHVLLGPSIGPCCYNVADAQDTRIDDFEHQFGSKVVVREGSKISLDPRGAARFVLQENGIQATQILSIDDCTAHGVVDYPSFYARKSPERFLAVIGIANS